MLDESSTVAIVGASLAGLRAAETLRREDFHGRIVMVGAERHLPYDRPPLSKQFLSGEWGLERLWHRSSEKLNALDLDLRLGRRAQSLDVSSRVLHLEGDQELRYDGLVIATGAQPRPFPVVDGGARVHLLRTLEDSISIYEATEPVGARLAVVGAGFIGSEVAATSHGRGADVTVIEALPVPLARVLGEQLGAVCAELHERNGVDLRTGVGVSRIRQDGVELVDGSVVAADAVVVGIGVVPTTEWLESSGLELLDGVMADATLHAGDDVVVAGDVARWYNEGLEEHVRIEHWTNASEQGMVAARNLLAGRVHATPYQPVPYFWSDQYDVKIQMIGIPDPLDEVIVPIGSTQEHRFVALYSRDGRLTAALGFHMPRQLMQYRTLLEKRASIDEALALQAG